MKLSELIRQLQAIQESIDQDPEVIIPDIPYMGNPYDYSDVESVLFDPSCDAHVKHNKYGDWHFGKAFVKLIPNM